MKPRVIAPAAVGIVCILLLSSCLGVNVNTRFRSDGSGVITLRLRISQQVIALARQNSQSGDFLTRADLERAYANVPGVKVESFSAVDTAKDRLITAVISFREFSAFKVMKNPVGLDVSLAIAYDGSATYTAILGARRQPQPTQAKASGEGNAGASSSVRSDSGSGGQSTITLQGNEQTNEEAQATFKKLLAGYSFVYSATAPRPILSHRLGELSSDAKTVTYIMPMYDYISLRDSISFTVSW